MTLALVATNPTAPRSGARDRVLRRLRFANAALELHIAATQDPERLARFRAVADTISAARRILSTHPEELLDD